MATRQATVDYIIDQLVGLPHISARKMFGEYALYCGKKVVALVCNDTFFVKITDEGRMFVGQDYKEGFAYPGAKASMEISDDLLENREWISELIRITEEHLPEPKPKKKKSEVL